MVGKLRLKLAALEVKGDLRSVQVDEPFKNEVFINTASGILSIWLNTESGSGSWNVITNEQTVEPWFVSTDGIVMLDGESMDIESAVERFAAKLFVKYRRPLKRSNAHSAS